MTKLILTSAVALTIGLSIFVAPLPVQANNSAPRWLKKFYEEARSGHIAAKTLLEFTAHRNEVAGWYARYPELNPVVEVVSRCRTTFPEEQRGLLKELLQAGVSANTRNSEGVPLLLLPTHCIRWGVYPDLELIRQLIVAGADVNARDNDGLTITMHLFTESISGDWISVLKNHKMDFQARDHRGDTWFHHAVSNEIVPSMLALGFDPNVKNHEGETPLHRAIRAEQVEAVELLIKAGANVNAVTASGGNSLNYAAQVDRARYKPFQLPILRKLAEAGVDPNVRDSRGKTPIRYLEVADTYTKNAEGKEEFAAVLNMGANLELEDNEGNRLLHDVALELDLPRARILFEKSLEVNAKNKEGNTPLHLYMIRECQQRTKDSVDKVSYLLRSHENRRNFTALPFFKLLVKKGADIRISNNKGETPWDLAAACADHFYTELAIMEMLIKD